MIHGKQTMTMTYDSVQEAIQNYLTAHFSVPIKLVSWKAEGGAKGEGGAVIEFEQMDV